MSRLSPDALFHFTCCLENLLGILDNTFYPRYCWEPFELIDDDRKPSAKDAFPMVCFCDITLSQLMKHMETYGKYGLGMRKEWGIRKGLNPVIYFNKNSSLANKLSVITNGLLRDTGQTAQAFSEVMLYIKPYEGIHYIGNGYDVVDAINVRFYDEREWRYVPDRNVMGRKQIEWSIPESIYLQPERLADANRKIETNEIRLSFNADDIKYVIIEKERERNEMVRELRNIKGSRYDTDTVDRLGSRIITVEEMQTDF